MRILHTADWHLGRIFYANYLTEDQAYVLEHQFLPLLKEAHVDAVVIAGDVYDRAVPPVEAVELWDSIVTRVASDKRIPMFVIGGNHDSGARLEVGHTLWAPSGLYVWGTLRHLQGPVIVNDAYGEIAFCPMPFSEPKSIANYLFADEANSSDMTTHGQYSYDEVYRLWGDYVRGQVPKGMRSVAMAHAFVSGSAESESERPLIIGGSYAVAAQAFSGFSYTALGHLHRPQRAGSEVIRYSGSLLKYSFDEAAQRKSFTLVDIDEKGGATIEQIPVEARRDVRIVEGAFTDIMNDEALHQRCGDDYVMVRLTDTAPVIDGLARLRSVIPQVMTLELTGRMAVNESDEDMTPNFYRLSERDLFGQFAVAARGEALTAKEAQYIDALWDRINKEEL